MTRKASGAAIIEAEEITITIPLGDAPQDGHEASQAQSGKVSLVERRLHLQAQLGPDAAGAFLRVRNGLRDRNAKLASGKPVWTNVDAFRWLMEQVAAEVA